MIQRLSSVCTEYRLHFWEVIGIWISGLGTLAAVIAAAHGHQPKFDATRGSRNRQDWRRAKKIAR